MIWRGCGWPYQDPENGYWFAFEVSHEVFAVKPFREALEFRSVAN
jgi:hypothetical protein